MKRLGFILVYFIVFLDQFGVYIRSELSTNVIQTDKGPVQGEILKTVRKSVEFLSFRGIPYGKPPVGYSRFMAPEEAESWTETFQATSEATPCPQMDYVHGTEFIGDEDCLNLNVYTSKINFSASNNNDSLLPVMVWMYGGSFKSGYTNLTLYGPDFLIENGVVVVAMNYRLGVLGFLSLNLVNATGNAGLKDQLLALKWVQRNIKAFGGDPSSVTIFGESAGAASVDYHVLSDKSRGLFHRSISMSGSPLCSWAFSSSSEAEFRAFNVGRELGIITDYKEELLAALYNQPAQNLVRAAEKISPVDPPFKPTLENKKIAGNKAFTTECSLKKYTSGDFSQLPHITGFMASETLTIMTSISAVKIMVSTALYLIKLINSLVPMDISIPFYLESIQAARMDVSNLTDVVLEDIIDKTTDVFFISGIDTKQKILTKYGSAPVYYYRNSFTPNPSVHKQISGVNMTGAGHADDLAYCWYTSVLDFPTDREDPFVVMQDRISRMWTNFAKYSNPTPPGMNDPLLNINWPVSGPDGIHLEIDSNFSVGGRPIDRATKNIERALNVALPYVNECSHNINRAV